MSIKSYELKDICKIRSGKRLPKGTDFSESTTDYKYIRARDIKNGKINGQELVCISEEIHNKLSRYIVNTDDIVITIVGASVGDVAYVTNELEGVNLTENAVRLTDFNKCVNSKYLMYVLNSKKYWELMQRIAGGAAQPKLGIYKIQSIVVDLPERKKQDKVADILSAYDDLIENKQKQIRLLEEAAQRLYKEWFVDLRFPGHENTPAIDDVPQGWKNGALGDIAFFKRGKTITKEQTSEGFVPVVAGGLEPAYYHSQSNTASPVITVSGSGANAGFTRMYHTDIWASDCSFVDAQNTNSIYFAYCVLKNKKSDIDALQKGAAQPHVYAKDINALKILVPDSICLSKFESLVTPFFEKIKALYQQIELSKEARNRLLPKLMNGELEV